MRGSGVIDRRGTGRGRLVDEIVEAAEDPDTRLVLLIGEAGVGKSFLLDAVAERLGADRAWGVAALAEVPGSSLAHLVAPAGTLPELIREVLLTVKQRLCVDDLDLCDPLSLALVERLLREPDRMVVATARTSGGRAPESVRDLAREPGTRVVEVGDLSREDLDAFVADRLGGPVDEGLGAELWRRTTGNPLYATQVLAAARADGTVVERDGVWTSPAPLPVPTTLRDAVTDRVAALGDAAAEAAQWLAGLGRVPVARVETGGRTGAVRQLLDAGIVTVDEAEVAFAHPLFAEVVWAGTDVLRRREVLREHVEAERRQRNPDAIRLAVLGLEVGDEVPPESLLAAARLATGGTDVEAALRLALAALAGAKGETRVESAALAADALMQLGRAEEAATLLERELTATRPGPHAILLAGLLHIVMTWGRGDERAAAAMLAQQARRYPRWTPVVREVFGFIEADGLTYAGRPGEALALTERLKVGGAWKVLGKLTPLGRLLPQVQARIVQSRAHALTQLGRSEEAVAQLTSGQIGVRLAELEELIPSWRGNYYSILSHASREAGDPRMALEQAMQAYAATLDTGFVWGRAWAACNVAASWLQIGDLDRAEEWVRRCVDAARAGSLADCERVGVMLGSVVEGSRGRVLDPAYVDRLASLPAATGFLHHQYPIGAAWRAHAEGRVAEAESIMAEGLDAAERDGSGLAVAFVCHEWLRLGRPVALADRLAAARTTGALTTARLALLRGAQDADPVRLVEATEEFERHGMPLFAAESAALAAGLSTGREAAALTRRAVALAAEVGSPRTPLLARLDGEGAPDPLTRRERQTAELATTMSNAEIAAHLTVSLRTVENHLARAYAKLGIAGRSELPAALGLRR